MSEGKRRLALGLALVIGLAMLVSHLVAGQEAIRVAGLDAPITIVYDRWGVPHLFASSEHDLFLAQGYVTAQDRLWQMMLRRQAARGRLSEWLGAGVAEADALLAGQDFYADVPNLDVDTRQALEAYTAGVNAYLLEFSHGISIRLDPWMVQDSLALARMMAWAQTLAGPDSHLQADLIARLGAERAGELWAEESSPYPVAPSSQVARQVLQLASVPLFDRSRSPGGTRLMTVGYSAPVLPPAWYMIGLHIVDPAGEKAAEVRPESPATTNQNSADSQFYGAVGASLPGLPGVVVGRGAERAWSMQWSGETLEAGRAGRVCRACIALDEAGGSIEKAPPTVGTPSEFAQALVPYLVALKPQDWLQRRVTPMMAKWDCRLEASSAPAAVYEAWVTALGRRALADELGTPLQARYAASGREPGFLARLALQPDSPWWDDITTLQRESRDEIMQLAYTEALEYLGRHYGDLHTIWEWGQMHAATFEHALGSTWPAPALANRGPVPLGGDGLTGPLAPFDPSKSFVPLLVPSLMWRVASSGEMWVALAGEQSGALRIPPVNAGLRAWRKGEYFPLLWSRSEVEAKARRVLVLVPYW